MILKTNMYNMFKILFCLLKNSVRRDVVLEMASFAY